MAAGRNVFVAAAIIAFVFLLSSPSLEAKPYGNYGFYSPYPPPAPADQVIYDFAPVSRNGNSGTGSGSGHRSTRDLAWKADFEAFLDGTRDPTCRELREMWEYAKAVQRKSGGPGAIDLRPFISFSPLENRGGERERSRSGGGGGVSQKEVSVEGSKFRSSSTDRRRMSTPNTPTRRKPKPAGGEDHVYGVVRTHAPKPDFKNPLHVRDPAKEIYGLLNKQSSSSGGDDDNDVFGAVRTHTSSAESNRPGSYIELLEKELYGDKPGKSASSDSGESVFGKVRYEMPDGKAGDDASTASFDKVRALVAANRKQQKEKGGDEDATPREGQFDLIRQRLMNTRLTSSAASSSSPTSSLRGRGSKAFRRRKNRQRKVREALERQILSDRVQTPRGGGGGGGGVGGVGADTMRRPPITPSSPLPPPSSALNAAATAALRASPFSSAVARAKEEAEAEAERKRKKEARKSRRRLQRKNRRRWRQLQKARRQQEQMLLKKLGRRRRRK